MAGDPELANNQLLPARSTEIRHGLILVQENPVAHAASFSVGSHLYAALGYAQ